MNTGRMNGTSLANGWKFPLVVLLWGVAGSAAAQIVVTPTPTPAQTPAQTSTQTQTATPQLPSADVAALLTQARAAAREARSSPLSPSPDQARWRDAIKLGEAARDLAPQNLEVLRFLAQTYSTVSWDSRAWEAWSAYLDAGGDLDEAALAALSEAGRKLGYARFSAGELDGAAEVFERVLELDARNLEAVTWLGRIALEQGESEAAERYWVRVLTLKPDDPTARYYLGQSREQLTYGADAVGAFNEGLAAYNEGRTAAALDAFSRAAEANPEFAQAALRAGRTALELGRPRAAQRFFSALLARDPQDQGAAYLLTLARAQGRWGAAASAFYAGQELYNQGQVEGAAERFVEASDANPEYPEAAGWAARSLQESGQAERAIPYWERVVALNPEDDTARYFLGAAQAQKDVGAEAVKAFDEGVKAYGEADLSAARAAFQTATAQEPGYAEAWGWLGRLAFEAQRYGEAREAYARALELEPGNATYRFFQVEAERLGER